MSATFTKYSNKKLAVPQQNTAKITATKNEHWDISSTVNSQNSSYFTMMMFIRSQAVLLFCNTSMPTPITGNSKIF